MASADEILSIVAAVLYVALFVQFVYRFARTRWWPYFFIALFCAIRIAAYIYISLYITEVTLLSVGVIFILLILARLYRTILPKLRYHANHSRGKFEATLVDRTRLMLLPIIACVIAGAVLASPDYSESEQHTGLVLRKISIVALLVVGLVFMYAAWNYRQRYPENKRPFTLCLIVTTLFVASLVYKVVYTFQPSAQTSTWAFFLFSPLLELAALCVLCVDLQRHFLGRKEDEIPEKGEHTELQERA
ncbi:hypothetical protein EDD11_004169 [Mortierella claussenii]|nr:hypothetical protein EDD11_004169 [Mortierella claussenii]